MLETDIPTKNSVCSIKSVQFKEQELGAPLSMSYAFNSPCQRAPLPSYKDPMNFWVLKVALQRLPYPPDVTGPKTGRHMKARVRMMGAGWHRAWSLLIWSWTWFDRLDFHVWNLQRLQWKSFSKPVKPLLTRYTEVLFLLLTHTHKRSNLCPALVFWRKRKKGKKKKTH